jgi:hypothetical protein
MAEILTWTHQVEIVLRRDFEGGENLIKHLAMLTSDAGDVLDGRRILKREDDGSKFDRFRPRSKYRQYTHDLQSTRPLMRPHFNIISLTNCRRVARAGVAA